jgi:hypothetical protein
MTARSGTARIPRGASSSRSFDSTDAKIRGLPGKLSFDGRYVRHQKSSQLPYRWNPRIGQVGAVGTGANGAVQVLPQRGMVLVDTCH